MDPAEFSSDIAVYNIFSRCTRANDANLAFETMVHKFPLSLLSCVLFFPRVERINMKPDEIVYVVCFPGLHSSSVEI